MGRMKRLPGNNCLSIHQDSFSHEHGRIIYQEIKVPLAHCRNCGGHFRVLPEELLPDKFFSSPVSEGINWANLQPEQFLNNRAQWGIVPVWREACIIHPFGGQEL